MNPETDDALASKHVLMIDDVPEFCRQIRAHINGHARRVTICTSPLRALRRIRGEPPDLVITTLVMKEMGGLELIRRVRGLGLTVPIVMITGHGNETTAIEATRLGASDYLEKPVSPEELRARLERILAARASASAAVAPRLDGMISEDPAMKAITDIVESVAQSNSRVLIQGETGTGKQLVAQAIHQRSAGRKGPFVEVNCAAIPENLLESELFGHEKGAFTGATERRIGRFEEAAGGSLFLDEVGEMGQPVQAKLLRVLQNGRFSRVGGNRILVADTRVIAATNRELQKEVEAGRFRADLFYRLHVVTLTLPPLRQRAKDIPLLAEYFLRRFHDPRKGPLGFTPAALQVLQEYSWPGNVRELEHLVEGLAVVHKQPRLDVVDLPAKIVADRERAVPGLWLPERSVIQKTYSAAREEFDRAYFRRTLEQAGGNMAAAARTAGIDRSNYFRMIKRLGLAPTPRK